MPCRQLAWYHRSAEPHRLWNEPIRIERRYRHRRFPAAEQVIFWVRKALAENPDADWSTSCCPALPTSWVTRRRSRHLSIAWPRPAIRDRVAVRGGLALCRYRLARSPRARGHAAMTGDLGCLKQNAEKRIVESWQSYQAMKWPTHQPRPSDRGREGATSPPSEPCERFSRTRLSSRSS